MRLLTALLTLTAAIGPARAAEPAGDAPPVVRIDSGRIRGAALADPAGVRVFRGIPYAAPPVGELRWRPPRAVRPWQGVRDCTEFAPICPQPKKKILREITGPRSEDCLSLNIWTAGRAGDKRPVMVWIHGGGFTTGAGSLPHYDGRQFAASGAVLVTINYRLGPFGFMAHPALSAESATETSGNYGLMDQVAALEWVKRNIAAFGGDPGNVTIFGESAGSVSVGCLLVCPAAEGLFHRAILQSGAPIGLRTPLRGGKAGKSAEEAGVDLARRLGIDRPAGDDADTAAALRAVEPGELLEAAGPRVGLFGKGDKYWPCVDGHVLPGEPADLLAAGRHHDVPVMIGTNADEGTLFLRQLPIRRRRGYELLVRRIWPASGEAILDMFPAEKDEDVPRRLAEVVTVAIFVAPTRRTARWLAEQDSPVWLYHFTRVSPGARRRGLGATHGIEIFYVFKTLRPFGNEKADRDLAETMHRSWLRFARTGDPNGEGLPRWPAYQAGTDVHLEFGDELRTGRDLWKEACDLFDRTRGHTGPSARSGRRGRRP
jgi:para-nitrobenzyl esterase